MLDNNTNSCQTSECKIIQIYYTLCKYFFFFHSLVGKLDGVNFLILIENDTDYLTPRGIKLHMFGSYVMEFRYHCRTRVLFV